MGSDHQTFRIVLQYKVQQRLSITHIIYRVANVFMNEEVLQLQWKPSFFRYVMSASCNSLVNVL